MARVIEAAASVGGEVIVEITGDCPIIDPGIVEQTVRMFRHNDWLLLLRLTLMRRPTPPSKRPSRCRQFSRTLIRVAKMTR